jgi:heme exporter protein C
VSVPLTYFSIRIWRTIHPVVIGGGGDSSEALGSFDMTADMRTAFFFSLFVFTVMFVDLFWNRVRLGQFRDRVEQLRMKLMV